MAISQIIWSLDDKEQLQPAELINEKELEDILAEHIEILDADWLLIGRQVRTVAGSHPLASGEPAPRHILHRIVIGSFRQELKLLPLVFNLVIPAQLFSQILCHIITS